MDPKSWLETLSSVQVRYLARGCPGILVGPKSTEQLIELLVEVEGIENLPTSKAETYTFKLLTYWDRTIQGTIDKPTYSKDYSNETCNDWIHIDMLVEDAKFPTDIKFKVVGCCISECCAGMTVEHMQGKSWEYIRQLTYYDLFRLINIKVRSERRGCITLALDCLRKLIDEEANHS